MAQLKDLIVSGVTRCIGKIYASELVGKLTGTADRAVADNNGARIDSYLKEVSIDNSGSTLTYTRGDNTSGTLNIRGTEYSQATDSTLGLTKLYSSSGDNTDGAMTQSAVTSLVNSLHTFEIRIVSELPEIGTPHILYFVPTATGAGGDEDTRYEEYVWIVVENEEDNEEGESEPVGYFEKIGMTTVDLATASDTVKGVSKIYAEPGQNTDGSMTQKAITDAIEGVYVSPAFTGTPTAPTVDYSDNSTIIATTAFVQAAIQHAIEEMVDSGGYRTTAGIAGTGEDLVTAGSEHDLLTLKVQIPTSNS